MKHEKTISTTIDDFSDRTLRTVRTTAGHIISGSLSSNLVPEDGAGAGGGHRKGGRTRGKSIVEVLWSGWTGEEGEERITIPQAALDDFRSNLEEGMAFKLHSVVRKERSGWVQVLAAELEVDQEDEHRSVQIVLAMEVFLIFPPDQSENHTWKLKDVMVKRENRIVILQHLTGGAVHIELPDLMQAMTTFECMFFILEDAQEGVSKERITL